MSAKNIIVGEIRTILLRLRQNNRWGQEAIQYGGDTEEPNLIEAMESLLESVSKNGLEVDQIDTTMLLHPFIMVLKSPTVTGPIVESVLTALDTFFQSGIITEESMHSLFHQHFAGGGGALPFRGDGPQSGRGGAGSHAGAASFDDFAADREHFERLGHLVHFRHGVCEQSGGGVFAVAAEGCGACASRHHDHHLPSLFGVVLAASPPRAAPS